MCEIRKDLKSFDQLFKTGTEIKKEQELSKVSDGVSTVQITKLKPFNKHPFKMYCADKLNELSASIKKHGCIL